jgi:hypothetical protein
MAPPLQNALMPQQQTPAASQQPNRNQEASRTGSQRPNQCRVPVIDNAFGEHFQFGPPTEDYRKREAELKAQLDEEMANEAIEERRNRSRVGDAVGEDGDVLFTRSTQGEGPPAGSLAQRAWIADQIP